MSNLLQTSGASTRLVRSSSRPKLLRRISSRCWAFLPPACRLWLQLLHSSSFGASPCSFTSGRCRCVLFSYVRARTHTNARKHAEWLHTQLCSPLIRACTHVRTHTHTHKCTYLAFHPHLRGFVSCAQSHSVTLRENSWHSRITQDVSVVRHGVSVLPHEGQVPAAAVLSRFWQGPALCSAMDRRGLFEPLLKRRGEPAQVRASATGAG